MNAEELKLVGETLSQILLNDNVARKEAETKLTDLRNNQSDKYAVYMVSIIQGKLISLFVEL